MRKFGATVTAAIVIFSSISLGFSPAYADSPSSPGLSQTGTRAFNDLTRCISPQQKLDVYYLIDQSNSLPLTDPESARADILATSLRELGGFDSQISVNYAVGFFGSTFDPWKGFTPVNPSTINAEASALASQVKSRNAQNETNWLVGLKEAGNLLQKQKEVSHGCQALIWLTDGGIWLAKKGSASEIDQGAVDIATSTLCDQTFENFRKANVSVFGVLLDNIKALQNIYKNNPTYYGQNDRGMALMRPLVEGSGSTLPGQQATTCGGPILPNYSAGALLIAKDPIELALQFLVLSGQTHGGTPSNLPPGNPTNFDIEQGVRKFQVLTTSKTWNLVSPKGVTYNSGSTDLDIQNRDGVQQITVTGNYLELGKWQFGFDKDKSVVNRLLLYSGLGIALDPGQYIGGSKTYISGKIIVEGKKEIVNLKDYRTHDFRIEQVTSTGDAIGVSGVKINDQGIFSAPFNLTANQTNLEIRITLQISTMSGRPLSDVSISKFLTILLPANYPTIDSPILLSPLNGPKGIAKGELTVYGPKSGNGEMCLAAPNSSSNPYGISIKRDTVERSATYIWAVSGLNLAQCVAVNQGEVKHVKIQVKNSKNADSNVIAEIPLKFKSNGNSNVIALNAPIDFETTIIRVGRGIAKILLFLFGIGIPIVILFLLNRVTSKLIFGNGIQRASYKVKIDSISGITLSDGTKINPVAEDFKFIPQQPDTVLYKDAIGTIRAKVSPIPLSEPWYEIESISGHRLVTVLTGASRSASKSKKRFASGQIARVRADMAKFWALQISEKDLQSLQSSASIQGTLVIYKRNKLGLKTQHLDRVAEVLATAGIWSRITEIKQIPLSTIKLEKEAKVKISRKSAKSDSDALPARPANLAAGGGNLPAMPPAPPSGPPAPPPAPPTGELT